MAPETIRLRQQIAGIFKAGIAAADPYLAIKNCLSVDNSLVSLCLNTQASENRRKNHWPQIHILAFGKAACTMARAAREVIPTDMLSKNGIVVTNYENFCEIDGLHVIGAGHPLPDNEGLRAAGLIAETAKQAKQGELLLVLVSGGGSALLPLPVAGISLEEKIATTDLLLASGANINQINCVRKHLSQIKGGGLANLAAHADLHAYILSDVLGDDLSAIASGPTVPDQSRFEDAIAILESYRIWDKIPASVSAHLLAGTNNPDAETPKPDSKIFDTASHTLIGGNSISLDAVFKATEKLGYHTIIYSRHLTGEAKDAAMQLAQYASGQISNGLSAPTAIIAGGETTVTLPGNGKGGRNQEMALAFALAAEKHNLSENWVFLSGGTDGRDGPTDAAGGIVDYKSLQRIRATGLEPMQMLKNHNSYPALQSSDDLLITGATGTNVADLQILLLPALK